MTRNGVNAFLLNGLQNDRLMKRKEFQEFHVFDQKFHWREIEENESSLIRLLDILTQNLLDMISIETSIGQIDILENKFNSKLTSSKQCLKFLNGFFMESHSFPFETIKEELLILISSIHFDCCLTSMEILDFIRLSINWFSDRPKFNLSFEECKRALCYRIIQLKWISREMKINDQKRKSFFDSLFFLWFEIDLKSWNISNSLISILLIEVKKQKFEKKKKTKEKKDIFIPFCFYFRVKKMNK